MVISTGDGKADAEDHHTAQAQQFDERRSQQRITVGEHGAHGIQRDEDPEHHGHLRETELLAGQYAPRQHAESGKHRGDQQDIDDQRQILHGPWGRGHQVGVPRAVGQNFGPDTEVTDIGEREGNQEGVAHGPGLRLAS